MIKQHKLNNQNEEFSVTHKIICKSRPQEHKSSGKSETPTWEVPCSPSKSICVLKLYHNKIQFVYQKTGREKEDKSINEKK